MTTSFTDWLNERQLHEMGARVSPSTVDDEGEGGDGVIAMMPKPGALPTYGDDLPITAKNRRNKLQFAKKGCNCK